MLRRLQAILGPRVPNQELRAHPQRYLLPTILMAGAVLLLLASFTQQYWSMTLFAPQYPKGLHVYAHLNRLDGDVREIDSLNHYIGMRPLEDAATLERTLSPLAIATLALLVAGTIAIHSRWAALLALPAVLFPAIFLLDLHLWLDHFGQNLDPKAALSSSIKPFTPPVLGEGMVGQFKTFASPSAGLWMAAAASLIVLLGLFFHRRAYKPLVDADQESTSAELCLPVSAIGRQPKAHHHRAQGAESGLQ